MPIISPILPAASLALLILWTLVVMRVLGFRGILSERTLGTYLVMGGLFGPLALGVSQTLVNASSTTIVKGLSPAVLMVPAIACLFVGRAHRFISMADGFLVGFLIGFGADLVQLGFDAAAGSFQLHTSHDFWQAYPLFPPSIRQQYAYRYVNEGGAYGDFPFYSYSVAGNGYWVGLTTLALVAGLRFVRRRSAAVVAAVLCATAAGLDSVFHIGSFELKPFFSSMQAITLHVDLISSAALIGLIALSLYEAYWVARALGANFRTVLGRPLEELQAVVAALADRKPREVSRLKGFRLGREARIAEAELVHAPEDVKLHALVQHLHDRLRLVRATPPASDRPPPDPKSPPERYPWRRRWQLGLGITILVILFSGQLQTVFSYQLFSLSVLSRGLTMLGYGLAALILWWYVVYPPRSFSASDADDLMQSTGEKMILGVSVAMVVVLIYGKVEDLYPLRIKTFPLPAMMLLLAAAASATTLYQSERLEHAPGDWRRTTFINNALALTAIFVVSWSGLAFFRRTQLLVHTNLDGPLNGWFSQAGNLLGDLLAVIVALAISYGLFLALQPLTKFAQRYLTRPQS